MPLQEGIHSDRWYTYSLAEQLGNVGSEVGRALKRRQEADADRFGFAFDRALKLLDLTAGDQRWKHSPKLREILRAREVLCDFLCGGNQYGSTPDALERYFSQFAYAARKDR